MKKTLDVLRVIYYTVGIVGMLACVPFYLGLYTINKKES